MIEIKLYLFIYLGKYLYMQESIERCAKSKSNIILYDISNRAKMLWLPRGYQAFLSEKALELETTTGSLMIQIITDWCKTQGFNCVHPRWSQKLVKMGDKRFQRPFIYRCTLCGHQWEQSSPYEVK